MGLAICKRLAELMGGCVNFYSEEGIGSSFWLELPLRFRTNERLATPFIQPEFSQAILACANETLASSLENTLLDVGYEASRVRTLDEANGVLSERSSKRPVLIVDHTFNGITGIEAAQQISSKYPCGPMILLLTQGDVPDAETLASCGVAACIAKPVRSAQLIDAVTLVIAPTERADRRRPRISDPDTPSQLGVRILVAEDNTVNQKVITRMLEQMGCDVKLARNGLEAVEIAEAGAIDLVLMDVHMPEVDGFQATARIRELSAPDIAKIPIIALTANAMDGDREKCLDAGMNDYLSKPVRRELLEEALRRWSPGSPLRETGERRRPAA